MKKIIVIFLLSVFIATPAFAATAEEIAAKDEYLKEVYDKAKELLGINDGKSFMAAEKLLNDALQSKYKDLYVNDDLINLYNVLGASYTFQLKEEDAIATFDKALEIDPKNERSHFFKAAVFADAQKYKEALEHAQKAKPYLKNEDFVSFNNQLLNDMPAAINAVTSPAALYADFKDNELKANNQYRGKEIALVGNITGITESALGFPQLEFDVDQFGMNKVICQFPKKAIDVLMEMKKGQKVSVIGKVSGLHMDIMVSLDNCRITTLIK